jgi:SAM-dependent methyltransferase
MGNPQTAHGDDPLREANREGRERLHPSLTNPSWLVLRERRKLFVRWFSELPAVPLNVLDLGGRIQPYRALLEDRPARYVAVDLRRTPLVDIIARAEQLPLRANAFDLVICTQVLEYVTDPCAVIDEIYRVLKPGGRLLLSAPAIFPVDSDQDRWRFLPAGLQRLLGEFSRAEICSEGNSVHGLFRSVAIWITFFVKPQLANKALRWTLIPLLNLAGSGFGYLVRSSSDQFAANFSALAIK